MKIATIQLIAESMRKLLIADFMKHPDSICSYKQVLHEHKMQIITTAGQLLRSKRATTPNSHTV